MTLNNSIFPASEEYIKTKYNFCSYSPYSLFTCFWKVGWQVISQTENQLLQLFNINDKWLFCFGCILNKHLCKFLRQIGQLIVIYYLNSRVCVLYTVFLILKKNHWIFVPNGCPIKIAKCRKYEAVWQYVYYFKPVMQQIYKVWSINVEPSIDRQMYIHIFIKGKCIVSEFFNRSPGNPRESTSGVLNYMQWY